MENEHPEKIKPILELKKTIDRERILRWEMALYSINGWYLRKKVKQMVKMQSTKAGADIHPCY